jgi:DNA-binding response OmpR family regulator
MKKNEIFQIGPVAEAWVNNSLKREQNFPLRILVVDDDPFMRKFNSKVLIDSCYQVDDAADGAAAWDALLVADYDLLITDNNMPKVTGVDLLKRVHATRMAMPVVMATGKMPVREFAQYPWLKPAAILIKQYTFAELLETVKGVLSATAAAQAQITPPSWQGNGPAFVLANRVSSESQIPQQNQGLLLACLSETPKVSP